MLTSVACGSIQLTVTFSSTAPAITTLAPVLVLRATDERFEQSYGYLTAFRLPAGQSSTGSHSVFCTDRTFRTVTL